MTNDVLRELETFLFNQETRYSQERGPTAAAAKAQFKDWADALSALLREREWRPIDENTPKTGHMIGYSWKWGVAEIMRYDDGHFGLATFNGNVMVARPIKWMPLPSIPEESGE